jgi:oxygen-independent coproporphyrinogen-3 oxidase
LPGRVVDALLREARFLRESAGTGTGSSSWRTVYIGGGTPSLLPPEEIFRLLEALSPGAAEVTVEANPGDITAEWLDAVSSGGAARLSLGVQSLDGNALRASGRRSAAPRSELGLGARETVLKALNLITRHWHGSFSADIIAGLPGETRSGFLAGLGELLSFGPSHVSMYSLIIGEKTPLGRRCVSDPVFEQALLEAGDELWLAGRDLLENAGFEQYEVSNFAISGSHRSVHNLVYWNMESWLGIGPGAVGTLFGGDIPPHPLPAAGEPPAAIRYTNTRDIAAWLKNPLVSPETEYIDRETLIFEYLMMGLRKREGISRNVFFRRFGVPLDDCIEPALSRWKERGLAFGSGETGEADTVGLTREGLLFLNRFLGELITP